MINHIGVKMIKPPATTTAALKGGREAVSTDPSVETVLVFFFSPGAENQCARRTRNREINHCALTELCLRYSTFCHLTEPIVLTCSPLSPPAKSQNPSPPLHPMTDKLGFSGCVEQSVVTPNPVVGQSTGVHNQSNDVLFRQMEKCMCFHGNQEL